MNRKKTFAASLILALALSFPVPCAVGDASKDLYERFRLFSDCSPMCLVIENLSSDAKKIGLTDEAIQAAVESRLRSARLYTSDESKPFFYVKVYVIGNAFSIRLFYYKSVYDPLSGNSNYAPTWYSGVTGTHSGKPGYIRSLISDSMDRFLLEFLRVNENACEKRFSLPKK